MKLSLFITFIFQVIICSSVFSQAVINKQNCREGENVEYCHQHVKLNELLKNEAFKKQWEKDQQELNALSKVSKNKGGEIPTKTTAYRIPVVFHVLHNDGSENITRAQILNALFIMNRDYRRLNADANNVVPAFQGMPADCEIEFVLATKAPNGQCFSGITRTKNAITSNGSDGNNQVDAIVAGNDVYQGEWPGNKYMNIFVCREIGGAAGYTYTPNNWIGNNMRNGIWVLHNYVGAIGTGDVGRSRTLTHEAGHWLNLSHVWGSSNSPGLSSNCAGNMDDYVDDTPETIGNTSCATWANTCSLDNAYWGFDQVDQVENYMDYSYCSKMFTLGQAQRMHNALNSNIGGRNNLHTLNNLIATGADSNLYICKADFQVNSQLICAGNPIQFEDASFNNVTSWTWSFPGASPSSSNIQNPIVTYAIPGSYSVTLIASDGSGTLTETKTNFITVLPEGVQLPYQENFETTSTLQTPISFWKPTGTGPSTFETINTVGSDGTKSVKLSNFNLPTGTLSELYSSPFDLSGIAPSEVVTLSFKYAYRKRVLTNNESLRFHLSTDCGETWVVRKTLIGNALSNQISASNWTPGEGDWIQEHVVGITAPYYVSDLRAKFSFQSGGGNNFFIDELNLYHGGPSSLSMDEFTDLQYLELYPNPTEQELNIRFIAQTESEVTLVIQDIAGKQIRGEHLKASSGDNLVKIITSDLASGIYFLNIKAGDSSKISQFVVK